MVIGKGFTDRFLSADDLRDIVSESAESAAFAERRVLVIIPDGTRTMPMPLMFGILQDVLRPRVKALDFLVALGTHPIMNDAQLSKLIGWPVVDGSSLTGSAFGPREQRATPQGHCPRGISRCFGLW